MIFLNQNPDSERFKVMISCHFFLNQVMDFFESSFLKEKIEKEQI